MSWAEVSLAKPNSLLPKKPDFGQGNNPRDFGSTSIRPASPIPSDLSTESERVNHIDLSH
jgi:hypothetical protein